MSNKPIEKGEQHPKEKTGFGFEFEDGEFIITLPNKTKYKVYAKNMDYIESPADGVYAYENDEYSVGLHVVDQVDTVDNETEWLFDFKDGNIVVLFPSWKKDNKYSFIPMDEAGELKYVEDTTSSYQLGLPYFAREYKYSNEKDQVFILGVEEMEY